MSEEKIIIDNIEIILNKKNIKNMYLRVKPPKGEVTLSAPYFISDTEIELFIKSKKEWILNKQKLIIDNKIKPPLKYKNGEDISLWGIYYNLELISDAEVKYPLIKENTLYLPVPQRSTVKVREKILTDFYRNELKKELPAVLEKCIKIVGKTPSEVKIRKMKNWGNCRYHDKRITLNLNLAKKDKICLEYVVIHELSHLIEFNHGPDFKKLMDKFMPDWREIKKKLNE